MDKKSKHNRMNLMNLLKATGFVFLILILLLIGVLVSLSHFNPSFTSFTMQENWSELERSEYSLSENWAPAEEIPEHLKWAVIASEDQRFYDHFGLDVQAIDKAIDERISGERQRGASTITQQVAKNLFLWPKQSFFRKAVEAVIALFIEIFWTKERILEVYLNIAEFGPGIYGVAKASDFFFGISASELKPGQSARLATVLPNPKRMRVEPPSPFVKERSKWVLKQMTQLSGIDYIKKVQTSLWARDSLSLRKLPKFNFSGIDSAEKNRLSVDSTGAKKDSVTYDFLPDSISETDSLTKDSKL